MTVTPLPEFVQIEPSGQCNLRCRMCPIQFRRDGPPYGPPAFMPYETFTHLLDQFKGVRELHLQGLGEPLMHPRFFDMVRYASGRGIRVTTNTNLTLLSQAKAAQCIESGLDVLHGSLDGATASTYEWVRTGARWESALAGLENLMTARKRAAVSKPHVHLVMVLMRRNVAELPGLIRLAAKWGVEDVFVQHLCHEHGDPSLPEHYTPLRDFVRVETLVGEEQAVRGLFDSAQRAAAETGIHLRLPRLNVREHPPGTPGRARCDWPWRGAYLSYEGTAMPCCMVGTPDRVNLGNMVERGVETVWNGELYQRFRARLESDTPPDVCASCSLYKGVF